MKIGWGRKGDEIPQFAGSGISLQFRPILHVNIDKHREREKLSREGGRPPSTRPCERGCCPPSSIPFIYVRMWVKNAAKCYKKVRNLYAAFGLFLHVNIDKRESKKI